MQREKISTNLFVNVNMLCWLGIFYYFGTFIAIHPFTVLQDLTYAELMVTSPVQRVHFTSTLGRPRTSNMKQQEPTIYAQVSFSVDYPHSSGNCRT